MSSQDLTQEEWTAVAKLLRATIKTDPYPLAPRLKPLKFALGKLDTPAPRSEPLPPPKPNSMIGRKKRWAVTGRGEPSGQIAVG